MQIEGEYGLGKPEAELYWHAMHTLGGEPAVTWMVGDNLEWEVAAPQRLGITGIWHDPIGRGLPEDCAIRPDRIIGLADNWNATSRRVSAGRSAGSGKKYPCVAR